MSKQHRRLLKAAEKFRKNVEKELERVKSLQKKSEKLKAQDEPSTAVDRLFERFRQKELQASGEIAWADQLLAELRAAAPDTEKTRKKVAGTKDSK